MESEIFLFAEMQIFTNRIRIWDLLLCFIFFLICEYFLCSFCVKVCLRVKEKIWFAIFLTLYISLYNLNHLCKKPKRTKLSTIQNFLNIISLTSSITLD